MEFDVCVVGAGMVGSAAAKYLAMNDASLRISLVGPGPNSSNRAKSNGGARGQHFDEGRITRRLAAPRVEKAAHVWAQLAHRSISSYAAVERESGMKFHHPTGFLWTTNHATECLSIRELAAEMKIDVDEWSERSSHDVADSNEPHVGPLQQKFPFFSLDYTTGGRPSGDERQPWHYFYEQGGAGVVNPRAMVAAQQRIAKRRGRVARYTQPAIRIDRIENDDTPSQSHDPPRHYRVTLVDGTELRCAKVVVTVGPFVNLHALSPVRIDYRVTSEVVTLLAVPDEAVVGLGAVLQHMPAVIQTGSATTDMFYMLPPRPYPEFGGQYFVKAGPLTDEFSVDLPTLQETIDWCDGVLHRLDFVDHFEHILRHFICCFDDSHDSSAKSSFFQRREAMARGDGVASNRMRFGERKFLQCAYDSTPNVAPYIGSVDGGDWFVVVGGNGRAAKSSDEIGRLAATMVATGRWAADAPSHVTAEACAVHIRSKL